MRTVISSFFLVGNHIFRSVPSHWFATLVFIGVAAGANAQGKEAESSETSPESIQLLISQLGSAEFAQRETASLALSELGAPALKLLEVATEHPDLEIRTRAKMIYREVYQAWFEDQAKRFIAGDNSVEAFSSWPVAQRLMGDSEAVRRLFVSLSRRYPEFVTALNEPLAARVAAAEKLADQSFQRQLALIDPVLEDVTGMMLVACDEPASFSESFNTRMMRLMQHHAFSDALKNSLAEPMRKLAAIWVMRSPPSMRGDVLSLTLQQRWPVGAELAKATLASKDAAPSPNPEAIQWSTIVLLEFGASEDIQYLVPLLSDEREIFRSPPEINPSNGEPNEDSVTVTQVRDVAMAGCFRFCEVRLHEAGFPLARVHSRLFDVEAMAFPLANPSVRQQVRGRLDDLLKTRGFAVPATESLKN